MRALTAGPSTGETLLRLSVHYIALASGYGGIALLGLARLSYGETNIALTCLDIFLVAVGALTPLLYRGFTVWLRPGEIAIRRYHRVTTYPSAAIAELSVAYTGIRRAPVAITTTDGVRVGLPVPIRTISGLKGSRAAQVDVIREWWRQEVARRESPTPPPLIPLATAVRRLANPYQAPTV